MVYEILMEMKPFADFSREDHDRLVCQMGVRPSFYEVPANLLPPPLLRLLKNAWDQNMHQRPTMDIVCHQLSLILINWQAEEVAWKLHQVAVEQESLSVWARAAHQSRQGSSSRGSNSYTHSFQQTTIHPTAQILPAQIDYQELANGGLVSSLA